MFSNDFATLTLYKDALKKRLSDYVIRFHSDQYDMDIIVPQSFQIVKDLIEDYHSKEKTIAGRLVVLVHYFHIEKDETVYYYHPSYQAEVIEDAEKFYFDHMLKICERMDTFNHHGSNFIITNVQEIHVHLSVLD